MAERKCPLCEQPVSEQLYIKITGIWKIRDEQEKAFKAKQAKLDREMKAVKKRFAAEKIAIEQKAMAEVKKKVGIQTKSLTKANEKLKADSKRVVEEAAGKARKAVELAEKKFNKDIRFIKKESQGLREEVARVRKSADKRIVSAVAEASRKVKKETQNALKVSFEASTRKAVELAAKRATKTAGLESKKLNNALSSAKRQMSTVVATNQKQQTKIEGLERQLAAKTTPQHEGLADEKNLMTALQKEHPSDKFTNTGKGGDVLHVVIEDGKEIGILIYECKRVAHWSNAHVEQAAQARLQRQADYAVLITNAAKKGTSGFFIQKGVVVIHTGGALALVAILREQLVAVARLRLSKSDRNEAIGLTMAYLQGAEFKNSMDVVIRKALEMAQELKKEQSDHQKAWERRYDGLKTVYVNATGVQVKTTLLISGKLKEQNLPAKIKPFPGLGAGDLILDKDVK